MEIRFHLERLASRLLDPRAGGTEVAVPLEVRQDPLTGRTVHVAHFGAIEPQPLDLGAYRRPEIRGFCPFCPEHAERSTPAFPPDLFPEGRLRAGEALLIPNLYPYDVHGAVCVLTREHVVPLEGLTPARLGDALGLGLRFWRRVRDAAPEHRHPLMGWNYMPPSGGGLVHPHIQFFSTRSPGNRYRAELEASERFLRHQGRDYWTALVEAEQGLGARYLGRTGAWHWLSAFAPAGVLGEVLGVLPGAWDLDALGRPFLEDLARGLARCFGAFRALGIHSFNAACLVGPAGQRHFAAHVRVAPRTFLNLRDLAPDLNFFQCLLDEPVSVVRPEDLAGRMAPFFEPDR